MITTVIVVILIWLLLGFLGALIARKKDGGSMELLIFLIFMVLGPITIIAIFAEWAMETRI